MTLDAYLADREIKEPAFAALIGVNQSTINRARKGQVPSPDVLRRIAEATGGVVTPNDFFALPTPDAARAA